jgi:uncharacterized protein YceK
MKRTNEDYSNLPYLTVLLGMAYLTVVMTSGCTSIKFETVTKDGNTITAHADSFLWDRQIKGFAFDYSKGTVTLESFSTNPDKESIGKLCDTIQTLAPLIPK